MTQAFRGGQYDKSAWSGQRSVKEFSFKLGTIFCSINMRYYFSPRLTLIGLALAAGMIWASFWQWQRHQNKVLIIRELEGRLQEEPVSLPSLLEGTVAPTGSDNFKSKVTFRRVLVSGEFDFEHEVVLRNRRFDEHPGVHILTPLKVEGLDQRLLVNRGFIPIEYSDREARRKFQRQKQVSLLVLLKEGAKRRVFSPKDRPTKGDESWIDSWLRPDLEALARQLPYEMLPFYAEVISDSSTAKLQSDLIATKSGKSELLVLGERSLPLPETLRDLEQYPIPAVDTMIPPGRHLGYVFEWAVMALVTLAITILFQFRQPRKEGKLQ